MNDFKEKFIRYIKRMGAGSMLISIIVHLVVIFFATLWVVSSVKPQREIKFQGGDNAGAPVPHPVKMSNIQPHLETLAKRLSVEIPNADVSLPDLPAFSASDNDSPALKSMPGATGAAGGPKGPLMPNFGFKEARPGGSLVGYLYDLKQINPTPPS